MKNHRLRAGLSLACSAVVIGLTAMSLVVFFLRTGDGNMAVHGTLAFRFFTVDSNILCALTCAGLIPAAVRGALASRVRQVRASTRPSARTVMVPRSASTRGGGSRVTVPEMRTSPFRTPSPARN